MRLKRILGAAVVGAVLVAQAVAPVSAGLSDADIAFGEWWYYWDRPVARGDVKRSWVWGTPIREAPDTEPYVEGQVWPGGETGERRVEYYDKARMEYWPGAAGRPHPDEDLWRITTGLLATELMTGRLQLGHDTFEPHTPSAAPVAGDPDSGDITPSYAAMGKVMGYQPIPAGWTIIQTIDAHGNVGADQRFAQYGVTALDVGAPTNHTVASVFWQWMTQDGVTYRYDGELVSGPLFPNPFYATGYPTTEAYWTRARVAGVETDVLVQCFERRCMTYTPSNPEGWRVEMGNIGQHYYHWRYVEIPAETQEP